METFLTFIAAAFALAGSPGPNTLSLAAVGAAFGYQRGIGYAVGLTVGMLIVIALVGSGVAGLIFILPGAVPIITALAAAYFLYLTYKIATAPPLSQPEAGRKPPSRIAAVFVSLANPKAYAAMAAMFSGFTLVTQNPTADTAAKVATLLAVIIIVNLVWLLAGAALTPFLLDARTSRAINVAFAAALLVSVGLAVVI